MANTYTQLYIHLVFAVKYRQALITPQWEDHLYRYITGIIKHKKHKLAAINGMPDHIHLLVSMHPDDTISNLVREIKKASSTYVKKERLSAYSFQWQEGFGAFSCSKSHAQRTIEYINNQKEHHRKHTFQEEYRDLLQEYEIDFRDEYLFDFIE